MAPRRLPTDPHRRLAPLHVAVLCLGLALLTPSLSLGAPVDVDPFSGRYPVEIPVLGVEQARTVVDLVGDADGVVLPEGPAMPGWVRAYADDEEVLRLRALGFEPRAVANEARRMYESVRAAWEAAGALEGPVELPAAVPGEGPRYDDWYTFDQLEAELLQLAADHPDLVHIESLGLSVQGRDLWILKVSDNVTEEENEPEFKFSSTIHGDEVTGMELCRRMLHYLVDGYGIDPAVTNLVDNVEIWLAPLHNPDGYVAGSRNNAHGQNLNRGFPDPVTDPWDDPTGREPEVQAYMYFGYDHNFILSGNYHGGALVMNIPWDCRLEETPDHDLLWTWAEGYSYRNPPMWNNNSYPFQHGVVLGAEWYIIHGGMQDWCYEWRNEMDITIEVSNVKWPAWSQMDIYWGNNRDSMLYYMGRTLVGVKGTVTDGITGEPVHAEVNVTEIGKEILTDPDLGDYHRMLLPRTYTLTFAAEGYDPVEVAGVVVPADDAVIVDVEMFPAGVSVGEDEDAAGTLWLSVPAPNPVRMGSAARTARMILNLPVTGAVEARVFDLQGRTIRTLRSRADGPWAAGRHELSWDGRTESGTEVGSGLYWIRVVSAQGTTQRKIVVLR